MSAAKHTPGPWQVNHADPFQVCDADGETRGCAPIATMHGTYAEKRANARLIAAAPELMEALERCNSLLKIAEGQFPGAFNSKVRDATLAANAVIAKATGGD